MAMQCSSLPWDDAKIQLKLAPGLAPLCSQGTGLQLPFNTLSYLLSSHTEPLQCSQLPQKPSAAPRVPLNRTPNFRWKTEAQDVEMQVLCLPMELLQRVSGGGNNSVAATAMMPSQGSQVWCLELLPP